MATKIGELTRAELIHLVEEIVEAKLLEMLGDPDSGLELEETLRDRLSRQHATVADGERGSSLEVMLRQLALD